MVLSAMLIWACQDSKQQREALGLLDEDTFADVLIDLHISSVYFNREDSTYRDHMFEYARGAKIRILENHEVAEWLFDSTQNWYLTQPAEMDSLYQRVIEKMMVYESGLDSAQFKGE